MPHCIVEYSQTLENDTCIQQVMQKVFDAALSTALFDAQDIKTRALAYTPKHIGGDQSVDFVHVTMRILCGRSTEQKQKLSETVFQAISGLFTRPVALSVDIYDIDKQTYRKQKLNTLSDDSVI